KGTVQGGIPCRRPELSRSLSDATRGARDGPPCARDGAGDHEIDGSRARTPSDENNRPRARPLPVTQAAVRVVGRDGLPGLFHRQYARTLANAFAPPIRCATWRPETIRPRLSHDPRPSAAPRSKAPWRNG